MAYVGERGRTAAVKYAEHAQPPGIRGSTVVRLRVDPLTGLLAVDFDYELPSP